MCVCVLALHDAFVCVSCGQYLTAFDYNGPRTTAATLADLYPPETREAVKILDVAAGTGLVGEEVTPLFCVTLLLHR